MANQQQEILNVTIFMPNLINLHRTLSVSLNIVKIDGSQKWYKLEAK